MPAPASADTVQFLDCRARVLTSGDETGGAFGLVEMSEVPAGSMPPLHVHHGHDEGFYVLEGEVTLFAGGSEVTVRAGDFFLAPRGVPHTYRVGETDSRWLAMSSPAGFERFVTAVAALDEPAPDRVGAVAAEHGIEILGPPGAMP